MKIFQILINSYASVLHSASWHVLESGAGSLVFSSTPHWHIYQEEYPHSQTSTKCKQPKFHIQKWSNRHIIPTKSTNNQTKHLTIHEVEIIITMLALATSTYQKPALEKLSVIFWWWGSTIIVIQTKQTDET